MTGERARRRMVAINLTLEAEAYAGMRLGKFDPEHVFEADRENVRQAARVFVMSTEKDGAFALQNAKAKQRASAYLRTRLWDDYVETSEREECGADGDRAVRDVLERLGSHLARYLACYHRQLTQTEDAPTQDDKPRWAMVQVCNPDIMVALQHTLCPDCARLQRDIDAAVGVRWPLAHEPAVQTGDTRVSWVDLDGLRCDRCAPSWGDDELSADEETTT